MEAQITVADMAAREIGCLSQQLDRAIFFTSPRVNDSHVPDQRCAFDGALTNWDQLDRTFAFANRSLLVPKYGIDHTECAKRSRVVRSVLYLVRELLSCILKGRASCRLITMRPSDKTLAPAVREWNGLVKASTLTHILQHMTDAT